MKSYPDSLPKHQQGRKRVSIRRQGNYQHKHHCPNPQYHQSNQAGSRGTSPPTCALARNVQCHQGDALVVSHTSGHDELRLAKWDGFSGAWHVSLAQIPNFQLTYYYPLNDSYCPLSSVFFWLLTRAQQVIFNAHFTYACITNEGQGDQHSWTSSALGSEPRSASRLLQLSRSRSS